MLIKIKLQQQQKTENRGQRSAPFLCEQPYRQSVSCLRVFLTTLSVAKIYIDSVVSE